MTIELPNSSLKVTVYGQPPSGNHMYEGYGKNRRKTSRVADYQETVTHWVKLAIRDGWQPGHRIVVNFWYYLGRDMDCTNINKVIEDGIAEALCPGIDPPRCCRAYDTRFLPRSIEKSIGNKAPYVEFELVNA